jgi:optic atrophy 3 protein
LPPPRAIENGANALAEGFLFGVAALIIIGETWRSSRSQSKRRDDVNDKLEDLSTRIHELSSRLDQSSAGIEERLEYERQRYRIFDPLLFVPVDRILPKFRNDELGRILERIVEIGLRGGWAEFEETPLMLPRIQLVPPIVHSFPVDVDNSSPAEGSASSRSTPDSQS